MCTHVHHIYIQAQLYPPRTYLYTHTEGRGEGGATINKKQLVQEKKDADYVEVGTEVTTHRKGHTFLTHVMTCGAPQS